LNVGFPLVHHQPARAEPDDDDDSITEQEDWLGRSVTMILRPGTCNALRVVQPQLEWSTLGGGMAVEIETRSIGLLDIHSISTSALEENRDDEEEESDGEDLLCFFTITTKAGHVHVFESITSEQSFRLVSGIKNISARISAQLISGDINAFTEFYRNAGETEDVRFSPPQAMVRLSHSFFD
jgi:hypothetical protein